MAISRRKFLGVSAAAAAASVLPWKFGANEASASAVSPTLPKWARAVRGLNIAPLTGGHPLLGDPDGIPVLLPTPDPVLPNTWMYNITCSEFTDQLHPALPPTTLWGYHDTNTGVTKHLSGVIVAVRGIASRLRFTNTLPNSHIIPVDNTVPGANQAHNRIATHLHGGFVPWMSDGGPFDWWTAAGNYATGLSFVNGPGSVLDNIPGQPMVMGQADYFYPNEQSTRLMWYHDHAFGITRLNAYAGIATGYLCLDPAQEAVMADQTALNGLFGAPLFTAPASPVIPSILSYLPLVIQEKIFVSDTTAADDPTWFSVMPSKVHGVGSLWYDHIYDPAVFRLLRGRGIKPLPNPSCIPEFFGDTMLVNGVLHPTVTLEPKPYRMHVLNATNARFLNLNLLELLPGETEITTPNPDPTYNPQFPANPPGPPMYQVGCEGGYLAKCAVHNNQTPADLVGFRGNLFVGPAERPDIVIDFTGCEGKEYILYNDLTGPYPGGDPAKDFFAGNPDTPQAVHGSSPDTRNLLKITIGTTVSTPEPAPNLAAIDAALAAVPRVGLEAFLSDYAAADPLTGVLPMPAGALVRNLTLNENFDEWGRLRQLVGTTTVRPGGTGFGRLYLDPATEVSNNGAVEVWNVFNITGDSHPMHLHLVNAQILKRQPFKIVAGKFVAAGAAFGPFPDEMGYKETFHMNPGEMIQLAMKVELPAVPFTVPASPRTGGNEYVWHCHILEHEEHDMMRPFVVK